VALKELERVIRKLKETESLLKSKYGVERIGIFGSVVRNEQTEESDVDLLVEFRETPSLVKYMQLKFFLEDVLGKRVDLVVEGALKPRIRDKVLEEVVYV